MALELKFETLIESNNYDTKNRWYPTPIELYRKGFSLNSKVDGYRPLIDNLAYSLQYLEFLDKELSELKLSSVIEVMIIKNYTITSMSILEGIFSNIIKSNDWWKKKEEEIVFTAKASKQENGENLIVKTEIIKKVPAENSKMTMDEMIKCLNKHHKGLSVDHLVYPELNRLRSLRNRIHLQKGDTHNDHDYNAFDFKVKKEVQEILYKILCSPNVTNQEYLCNYDFLKSKEE